jgi:hypothetical protein
LTLFKESIMSKGQRGNKEAKKPKKARSPGTPPESPAAMPKDGPVEPDRRKTR